MTRTGRNAMKKQQEERPDSVTVMQAKDSRVTKCK
jgi:hypothetical protein